MIAPDVDQEREALNKDLRRSSCVVADRKIDVTLPMRGHNILQNSFFTDGKAIQVLLNCSLTSAVGP